MDRVVAPARRVPRARRSSRRSGSTATTTSPSGRPTRAGRCGCPARAPSRHAGASPASSRARWAPRSYVVEGLGNAAALYSAPHGAGRQFSRTAARRQFTRDQLRAAMVGIEYRDTDAFVDEIPAAYKDIDR